MLHINLALNGLPLKILVYELASIKLSQKKSCIQYGIPCIDFQNMYQGDGMETENLLDLYYEYLAKLGRSAVTIKDYLSNLKLFTRLYPFNVNVN